MDPVLKRYGYHTRPEKKKPLGFSYSEGAGKVQLPEEKGSRILRGFSRRLFFEGRLRDFACEHVFVNGQIVVDHGSLPPQAGRGDPAKDATLNWRHFSAFATICPSSSSIKYVHVRAAAWICDLAHFRPLDSALEIGASIQRIIFCESDAPSRDGSWIAPCSLFRI